MPKTEKKFNKSEYDRQFQKKTYYRLNVVLPKNWRELIDESAARAGMSKNAFIKQAIENEMRKFL